VSFAGKCLLRRGSVNAFSHWKPGDVPEIKDESAAILRQM
jgi:hypothetical protein